ncbi:ArsR family transcriptional regulator [Arthrobacter sp. ERGS1:01]|nr:ArsR family transcriptional regulator [Arthrobacter sp. ERGS1:01]
MSQSSGRVPEHPTTEEITLQRVLEALVDPVRRSIAVQLHQSQGDIRCGGFDLPVARSTATHHFNVLRDAGVIRQYYVGTSRMNALRSDDLNARFPGLLIACTYETTGAKQPS